MTTLRILLYRAGRDGKWLDNAISAWTHIFNWGTEPYSHAEGQTKGKCFPSHCEDEAFMTFQDHEYPEDFYGTCYTSTTRGDNKGTVKRPASEVLKHPGRWDYCDVEIDEQMYPHAIGYMERSVAENEGYGSVAFRPWGSLFAWALRVDVELDT